MRSHTLLSLTATLLLPVVATAQTSIAPRAHRKVERKRCEDSKAKKCRKRRVYDGTYTPDIGRLNRKLNGRVIDFTNNHDRDRRIFSHALMDYRDMYVYLPPGFDRYNYYPLMIYLHGILQDERGFLEHIVPELDNLITYGKLPPLIAVAPDGSLDGFPSEYDPGSFFINGPAGNFQDYVMNDVWNFMVTNFPIRPEPEAHILAGVSMGGLGAFNAAIKYRHQFKLVIGAMPVLNLRWMDLKGNYHANFDPYNWGWRNSAYDPNEILGDFGLLKIRVKDLIYPVFGAGPDGVMLAHLENPIEMIDRYHVRPGELDMFIGYGAMDEFNLDAQAESFIYLIRSRGLGATVYVDPNGRHSQKTASGMIGPIADWLANRLRHYHVDQPLRYPIIKPVREKK